MVCKNCGADLKPGVKYCLNCGEYITEEDENVSDNYSDDSQIFVNDSDSFKFDNDKPRKKKKKGLKIQDLIIYGVLGLIIIISFIIIIVSLNSKPKEIVEPTPPVVIKDNEVDMDNYVIKFSGKLDYVVSEDSIYITDKDNYKFSYTLRKDNYEKYVNNKDLLKKDLEKNDCNVLGTEIKDNGEREYLLYKFEDDEKTYKYLYITDVNKKLLVIGTITEVEKGDWSLSLNTISNIIDTMVIDEEMLIDDEKDNKGEEKSNNIEKKEE